MKNKKEFFKSDWKIIECLNEPITQSQISRRTNTTYAHVVNRLKILESKNILGREKRGRVRIVFLTDKGKKLRTTFLKFKRDLLLSGVGLL